MWFEQASVHRTLSVPKSLPEARRGGDREPSDDALMCAVARGDRAALATLYDRQAPLLLSLGTRILSRNADSREAEDVLHDVFVEVWKHAGDFDPARASVRTWLCLRMRSRCLDRLRALVRRKIEWLDEGGMDPAAEELSDGADLARVQPALYRLSPPQREVLVLGYFHGLSTQEMADRLGIPMGTVKSRVAAGLTQLRCILSDHAPEGVAS